MSKVRFSVTRSGDLDFQYLISAKCGKAELSFISKWDTTPEELEEILAMFVAEFNGTVADSGTEKITLKEDHLDLLEDLLESPIALEEIEEEEKAPLELMLEYGLVAETCLNDVWYAVVTRMGVRAFELYSEKEEQDE